MLQENREMNKRDLVRNVTGKYRNAHQRASKTDIGKYRNAHKSARKKFYRKIQKCT